MFLYILIGILAFVCFYIARIVIISRLIYGNYIAYESYLFNLTIIDYLQPNVSMEVIYRLAQFGQLDFDRFIQENMPAIKRYLLNPFVWNRWKFFSDFNTAKNVAKAVNSKMATFDEMEFVKRMSEFINQMQELNEEEV